MPGRSDCTAVSNVARIMAPCGIRASVRSIRFARERSTSLADCIVEKAAVGVLIRPLHLVGAGVVRRGRGRRRLRVDHQHRRAQRRGRARLGFLAQPFFFGKANPLRLGPPSRLGIVGRHDHGRRGDQRRGGRRRRGRGRRQRQPVVGLGRRCRVELQLLRHPRGIEGFLRVGGPNGGMGLDVPGVAHRPDGETPEQQPQPGGRSASPRPSDAFRGQSRFALEINVGHWNPHCPQPRHRRSKQRRRAQQLGSSPSPARGPPPRAS